MNNKSEGEQIIQRQISIRQRRIPLIHFYEAGFTSPMLMFFDWVAGVEGGLEREKMRACFFVQSGGRGSQSRQAS